MSTATLSVPAAAAGDSARVRIAFDRVSVDFPTQHGPMRVLDDVSFDIRHGEFVSIIGPSGCGKTTLMNIVGGFVQPTSGRVLLDGKPVQGPGPDRGVIFQEYGVFPWLTVRQNIAFALHRGWANPGRQAAAAAVERWIEQFGLGPVAGHQPHQISGGQRQRTALARALVHEPDALLLDEPFAALDKGLRQRLREELVQLQAMLALPLLVITHDDDDVRALADDVVNLNAGRVVAAPSA